MTKIRRVVVTGMGVVTPIGLSVKEFWKGLLTGQSGAANITRFDAARFDTRFACELKGFDPLNYLDRKLAQHLDLYSQFALAAASEALNDAGLAPDELAVEARDLFGVAFGSAIGGITTLQKQTEILLTRGPDRISPFAVPMFLPNMAGAHISMRYGLRGPCYSAVSACATGNDSIGTGFSFIRDGEADLMLVGGSEAGICEMGVGSFNAMKALSRRNDDPQKASRPFDAKRDGFVMGEGAGVLILEEFEHALQRGARIYAEVLGVGQAADAYHMTLPHQDGQARALKSLLRKAGLEMEEVDYINMHATSTIGDAVETKAIKQVFGELAPSLSLSSTKGATGHLLGAAGAVEAIAAILATVYDTIPPTINFEEPDAQCDLNYTFNKPQERKVEVALSNSFGFGGHSSCVGFRKAPVN
jgi:3-oxoacyl-[acyl-carrier-protein] synthase II